MILFAHVICSTYGVNKSSLIPMSSDPSIVIIIMCRDHFPRETLFIPKVVFYVYPRVMIIIVIVIISRSSSTKKKVIIL